MAARKDSISKGKGGTSPGRKEPAVELVPAHPLSGREALFQIAVLIGIPVVLLVLAHIVLHQFFPSLGY